MATNATIAMSTTIIDPPQVSSFFTKLPTEIRLVIYRFALDDEIADITNHDRVLTRYFSVTGYQGALALLHTSRLVRAESARELLPVLELECSKCEAETERQRALFDRNDGLETICGAKMIEEMMNEVSTMFSLVKQTT